MVGILFQASGAYTDLSANSLVLVWVSIPRYRHFVS